MKAAILTEVGKIVVAASLVPLASTLGLKQGEDRIHMGGKVFSKESEENRFPGASAGAPLGGTRLDLHGVGTACRVDEEAERDYRSSLVGSGT